MSLLVSPPKVHFDHIINLLTKQVPTGVEFAGIGLKKCVTSVLAPHTGRVITAECSPHHRNAILSAASDNEIRLYSLLQVILLAV